MKQIETSSYKRITKQAARKLYNCGGVVYVLPNKTNPDSIWCCPAFMEKSFYNDDFDRLINEYVYYNCNNESGTRAAYYVKQEA